jgi:drug/metabolite transporter (DMT)-like permease
MIETWLLLAFGAILLYGSSQVAQKLSLDHILASSVVFTSLIVATPIYAVFLVRYVVTGELFEVGIVQLVIGFVAATFGQIGYYLYVEAAQKGPISIVGSVTAAYPIMVIAVAIIFLSETPGEVQLAGAVLVTASIIGLSYMHGRKESGSCMSSKCLTLCIASLLAYGLWAIFTKLALDDMPTLLFLGIYALVIPPTVFAYYILKGIRLRQAVPSWSVPLIIAIIASEVANIGFIMEVYAVDGGPASIVFPLIAAYPVVVIILARAFLKEQLGKWETLMVGAVATGIVLISMA